MRRLAYIVTAFVLFLLQVSSCRWISSVLHDEVVVAEAGGRKLYKSELDAAVPRGLPAEDSVLSAKKYIVAWATNSIFQEAAEMNLTESEKDVTRELNEYRNSLLKFRYEQRYVNERLDTVVTDDEIADYYRDNQKKFVLSNSIVRGRYLKILADSPMVSEIKKKMSSSEVGDILQADSLAYLSAYEYHNWDEEWVEFSVIADRCGESEKNLLESMKGKWIECEDIMGVSNILYMLEIHYPGTVAPFEYCVPRIKDIIISSRKHELVTNLERDLLDEARESGNFVIY